jgi:hypothetical protein
LRTFGQRAAAAILLRALPPEFSSAAAINERGGEWNFHVLAYTRGLARKVGECSIGHACPPFLGKLARDNPSEAVARWPEILLLDSWLRTVSFEN